MHYAPDGTPAFARVQTTIDVSLSPRDADIHLIENRSGRHERIETKPTVTIWLRGPTSQVDSELRELVSM